MNVTQLLENSKNISLILPPEADEADEYKALLLACGLKKLGKQVSIEHSQTTLDTPSLKEKIFVVALKGLAPWIAKVRYEKEAQDLKLYFTLNQGEISSEALSLQIQNQADLTIIVGDKARLHNPGSSPSTTVLSDGQVKKPLLDILYSKEDSQTRLLGIVLSKFEYIARLNVAVIVLRQQDLQDLGVDSKHIPLLVPELKESFGDHLSYLFLLDSLQGTQGLLWSSSSQLRTKFRDIAGGQQKGPWVLLRPAPLSSEQLKYAFLS